MAYNMLNIANQITTACEKCFYERHDRVFHDREEIFASAPLRGVSFKVFAQNVNDYRDVSFEVELYLDGEQVSFGCCTVTAFDDTNREYFYRLGRIALCEDGSECIVVPNRIITDLFPEHWDYGVTFCDWASAVEEEVQKVIER